MKKSRIIAALMLLLFGCAVVTFALIVEPSGEIHYSVNTFFGEEAIKSLILKEKEAFIDVSPEG